VATAGMSAEENKAVVRRYIEECWNDHNIDATDELVSPDYLNHAASAEYQRTGAKYSLNWLFSVFPDHRFDIEDAVAEGDTVAVRGMCSGTHEGELWGIPPTTAPTAGQVAPPDDSPASAPAQLPQNAPEPSPEPPPEPEPAPAPAPEPPPPPR
jgi:predicted ester cyclase